MSTILTALKKSQQQRDRGTVPRLSRTPDPRPAPRRRPWSWWVGGALALNGVAVLVALVWWPGGNLGSGETAAGAVTAVAAPAPVELQLATSEHAVVSAPQSLPPPSSQEPSAGAHLASTTPQITTPQAATPQIPTSQVPAAQPNPQPVAAATPPAAVPPVAETGGQEAPPTPSQAPSAETESLPAPVVQTDAEEPDPAPPVTSALARASPQPAALPDMAPPTEGLPAVVVPPEEPIPEPDPYASLPLLHQLSYSIQTALPDLSILVHVYGEDPQDRFVIIQRSKYREGDQLGDHLNLEAITPSGAVLRYQDTGFRINR